jgi:hypothetical protein
VESFGLADDVGTSLVLSSTSNLPRWALPARDPARDGHHILGKPSQLLRQRLLLTALSLAMRCLQVCTFFISYAKNSEP